ncbi:hypothetical protein AAC387_Pa05g0664 [Persea americana]
MPLPCLWSLFLLLPPPSSSTPLLLQLLQVQELGSTLRRFQGRRVGLGKDPGSRPCLAFRPSCHQSRQHTSPPSRLTGVQKCHVGLERLGNVHSKVTKLEEDKKNLQAALGSKDKQLKEKVRKNTGLVADLDTATAEGDRLNVEVETQVRLAIDLVSTLEKQRDESKSTLQEQKAELKSALERQKAELEEKFQAEVEVAYNEGAQEVMASYKAQVLGISQKVWELGWMATLKEAGVPEDPAYKNPSKFPSLDPGSSSVPGPSTVPNADADATV